MTTNTTASPAVLQRLSQLLDSVRKWGSDPAISSDVAWAYKMCADALDGQIRCLTPAPDFNIRIPTGMTVTGVTVVDAPHQDGEAVAWLATDPNVTPDPAETVTNDPSLALHWRADGYVVTSLYIHPAPAAVDDAIKVKAWEDAFEFCRKAYAPNKSRSWVLICMRDKYNELMAAAMQPKAGG